MLKLIIQTTVILVLAALFYSCKSSNINNKYTKKNYEYMSLEGYYESVDENNIIFFLKAERNKINEGEYLPNSENIRLEIFDSEKRLIYNSAHNMNFLQVISEVLPMEEGKHHDYEISWNYLTNDGKKITPGNYTAKLTIPAVPNNYSIEIDFGYQR